MEDPIEIILFAKTPILSMGSSFVYSDIS